MASEGYHTGLTIQLLQCLVDAQLFQDASRIHTLFCSTNPPDLIPIHGPFDILKHYLQTCNSVTDEPIIRVEPLLQKYCNMEDISKAVNALYKASLLCRDNDTAFMCHSWLAQRNLPISPAAKTVLLKRLPIDKKFFLERLPKIDAHTSAQLKDSLETLAEKSDEIDNSQCAFQKTSHSSKKHVRISPKPLIESLSYQNHIRYDSQNKFIKPNSQSSNRSRHDQKQLPKESDHEYNKHKRVNCASSFHAVKEANVVNNLAHEWKPQ